MQLEANAAALAGAQAVEAARDQALARPADGPQPGRDCPPAPALRIVACTDGAPSSVKPVERAW